MPNKTVTVRVEVDTGNGEAKITALGNAARSAGKTIESSFQGSSTALDRVGSTATRAGAVAAAGLGLVAKAAIDWESSWTGVTKTVSGTVPQMAALEGELRGLATTLPASHDQIAAVAEAAGQLGIERGSITAFTKTMIDLGNTTDLTAEAASTSFAQFLNIMGDAPATVGRLGSTLVALGNDGASTESQILQLGLRFAGVGNQMKLSSGEVLGFASAIASTGIGVEAGGTAISQVFSKIDQAVRTGGDGLDQLAATAGMTSSQFAKAFRTDAAGAVSTLVQGFGRLQASGGNVRGVLKSIGVVGQYQTDVINRLASATKAAGAPTNLLADALKLQSTAYRDNSALANEANKRYQTTAAQAKIAWNQITDAAITGGQAMLPAVATIATAIGSVAKAFASMPEGARFMTVALVATVATLGLVGGGALKAITGLAGLRGAFQTLGASATIAGRAMKISQIAIPGIGIALFAATTAMQFFASRSQEATTQSNAFSEAMQTIEGSVTRATAAMNDNVRVAAANNLQQQGAFANADKLGLSYSTITDAALGQKDAITQVNTVLARNLALNPQLSKSNSDQRNAAQALSQQLGGVATQSIAAVKAENDRRAAVQGGAGASETAAQAAERHAAAAQAEAQALEETVTAAQAAANALLALSGSNISMEAAIDAGTKSIKDYRAQLIQKAKDDGAGQAAAEKHADAVINSGKALDINTAAGRANKQALNGIASATLQYTASLVKSGASAGEVVAANERGRNSFIKTAHAMGLSTKEATRMASALFSIPSQISSQVVVKGTKVSEAQAKSLNKQLQLIPASKRAEIVTIAQTQGAKAAQKALNAIHDKDVLAHVVGDIRGAKNVDQAMKRLRDRLVKAKAAGDERGAKIVKAAMDRLRDRKVNAKAIPTGEGGVRSINSAMSAMRSKSVTATVTTRHVNITVSKKILSSGTANSRGAPYTGGLMTHQGLLFRGPLQRSNGGPVWGAGTATSDSIPSMLSNGEFVQRTKAVDYYGVRFMDALNNMRIPKYLLPAYASGGLAGGGLAAGGLAPTGSIDKIIAALVRALTNPLGQLNNLVRSVAVQAAASAREQRKVAGPAARVKRATASYGAAVERRNDLRDQIVKMKRQHASAGALRAANLRLAAANNAVSRTSREKTLATQAYTKVSGPAKAASDRLAAAQAALAEKQKEVAESARQISKQFSDTYRSQGTDAQQWIDLMQQGATDITAFTAKIQQLRKSGLSETLVQQIIGLGAVAGSEIAGQIAMGGAGLVQQLNRANNSLQSAADALGYRAATGTGRYDSGGYLMPGQTGINMSGKPEPVFTADQWSTLKSFVAGPLGFSRSASSARTASASGAPVNMTVWVQSPIDGSYFEAKIVQVADARIDVHDRVLERKF